MISIGSYQRDCLGPSARLAASARLILGKGFTAPLFKARAPKFDGIPAYAEPLPNRSAGQAPAEEQYDPTPERQALRRRASAHPSLQDLAILRCEFNPPNRPRHWPSYFAPDRSGDAVSLFGKTAPTMTMVSSTATSGTDLRSLEQRSHDRQCDGVS